MNAVFKWLLGLTGAVIAIAPAQASIGGREIDPQVGQRPVTSALIGGRELREMGIEALEDALFRHPSLKAAIAIELAKFECNSGDLHRCGADGNPVHQSHRQGYGG